MTTQIKFFLRRVGIMVFISCVLATAGVAQREIDLNELGGQVNIISTAVPFLGITPDSRAGAMGNAGVASTPSVHAQHVNPAQFAFISGNQGAAMSYTPWLRKLVSDINMYYLTGYTRIDELQVVSASLRYFTLGEIFITDTGQDGYHVKPNEFAIDVAYSRLLSERFSGAVAFRYIRSDLYGGMVENMEAGNSFAADLAFYFQTPTELIGNNSVFTSGINISNIGNKISYDGGDTRQFIPTNLRLGVGLSTDLDAFNSLNVSFDAMKLLVPTPGVAGDMTREEYFRINDMSVTSAMFRSFTDAPGGFKEEMQEIAYAIGLEYWYDQQFAIRAGYFHEHENKGNRKHFTAGIGLKFNMLSLDASYIIPVVQNNPLANTVRFSLGIDIDQLR
ncbi:type IX secretion system outer membrane channel protein PorV [Natronoflexus pectinivorans]|uniref:Type IX secretion system protein PorV domain-containing protein n=1 Tax=Natronoflexus pectinivorans TaxID=682526 RepID=A0A4R2GL14_9BACT|nr:type IX secretion system outer membrane channel protein PorV [Natronoflexus pectinivorans]TCO09662.1 hypothetical protein EV194_10286 [Natronoflexus pectinivorans]